jgi:hypothetical protein
MSGLITAGLVLAAGSAVYAGAQQKKASKAAANAIQNGVQTFNPIEPNAPLLQDWRRTALDANNYNFNHLNDYFGQAGRINQFNQNQAVRGYSRMQPYFSQLQNQIGSNALSFARGQLPQDVVSSIGRAAASRGLASGFGQGSLGGQAGSGLGNLNLRNLGLQSLQLSQFGTNLGIQANQAAAALTPTLFRPESLMVSPQQAIAYEQQNLNTQNEAMRYWNQLQNEAMLGNVAGQNRANQTATETRLAGDLASAQAIAQAGSTLGGGISGMAMSQPTMGSGAYGNNFGASYIPGAARPAAPAGYGYVPGQSGGFYKLT